MQAESLLKAVADRNRLKILSLLKGSPKVVEQIAAELNISVSTASFHLEKLKAAGLVCDEKLQYYKKYSLTEGVLDISLNDMIDTGGGDVFERSVVGESFANGRIEKLPVQRIKREIVLREIAKNIKPNRAYSERAINIYIADYCDDFVTVRKELLKLGVLSFKNGEYRLTNKK